MGGPIDPGWPCTKGYIPDGLDKISSLTDARARLTTLRNALLALGTGYLGIENVFKTCILDLIFPNDAAAVTAYLKKYWFDPNSPSAYFPGIQVAQIYGDGVLKCVELSLGGTPDPTPIDAWWVVDQPNVKMLSLALVDSGGVTRSKSVVLLVLTPRPPTNNMRMRIVNTNAVAWVTEYQTSDAKVITHSFP
jgi:hypothetical protein